MNQYVVAKHLYKTYYPKPYKIICYHCQQSAEKIINGVVVRYPSELFLEEHHVRDALKMADEIIKWGKQLLNHYNYTKYGYNFNWSISLLSLNKE